MLFALTGCDSIKGMTELFEKRTAAQEAIKKETGWESQVGFNLNNGVLTNITVILNVDDVRDRKVADLESLLKKVLLKTFERKPRAVYIQIATSY